MFKKTSQFKKRTLLFVATCLFWYGATNVFAQSGDVSISNTGVSYVPLIGITSVPEPSALPNGPGEVVYHYAVKNFLREVPLTDVYVVDDICDSVKFVEGDDNADLKLDFSETWRYACTVRVSVTTQSTATAVATAGELVASHDAYATVVVGTNLPPPLVSIINITKVAYPLSLPPEGGVITFTYKVSNPGIVPLSNVIVSDEKCSAVSNKLGDRNNNSLLDVNEVWIYTCKTTLKETTTNTVHVYASANGLRATSRAIITVTVRIPGDETASTNTPALLEETATDHLDNKIFIWAICSSILVLVFGCYIVVRDIQHRKLNKQHE